MIISLVLFNLYAPCPLPCWKEGRSDVYAYISVVKLKQNWHGPECVKAEDMHSDMARS